MKADNRLLSLCGVLPKNSHQRFAADNWQAFCGYINPLLAKIKQRQSGLVLPDTEGFEVLMACTPDEARSMLTEAYFSA